MKKVYGIYNNSKEAQESVRDLVDPPEPDPYDPGIQIQSGIDKNIMLDKDLDK